MTAETTETHISTLFLTDDRVYKILKPVSNGFLDHRNTADRIAAAHTEFALNRRFAPDVYLGLADVFEDGELADRMIVMKRLPAERSLTAIIKRYELDDDHLRSIARAVATVHEAAEPQMKAGGPGTVELHLANWEANFAELEPHVGPILDEKANQRISELARNYIDANEHVFEKRRIDGHIRDGHGDLLADDIYCLDDGPRILDCLAFRDDLRISDVLSDIGFLAMDIHRLAGPRAAQRLLHFYSEFTGEAHPASLAHHYVAYRAHVRCKIACLRAQEGSREFVSVARMYHRIALDHLERAQIRLVLVGGGPGTGKTTLAQKIGESFGWDVLSTDETRKDVAHVDHFEHAVAQPDEGIYKPTVTVETYVELLRRAEILLKNGHSVILDASWTSAALRQQARTLAERKQATLVELSCHVDIAIARERVARRLADGWNPSDATPEIVDHLASIEDPWPTATVIETARPLSQTFPEALRAIRQASMSGSGDYATTNDAESLMAFWGKRHRFAVAQNRSDSAY